MMYVGKQFIPYSPVQSSGRGQPGSGAAGSPSPGSSSPPSPSLAPSPSMRSSACFSSLLLLLLLLQLLHLVYEIFSNSLLLYIVASSTSSPSSPAGPPAPSPAPPTPPPSPALTAGRYTRQYSTSFLLHSDPGSHIFFFTVQKILFSVRSPFYDIITLHPPWSLHHIRMIINYRL